jgi:hypothetical protein
MTNSIEPSRPGEFHPQHRVAGGGCPPPAPTERSGRISRTTLFKGCFTAQLVAEASDREATASAAVAETVA